MNPAIERRLAQVETTRIVDAPARILAGRPVAGEEVADALANWQAWVASGQAGVMSGALRIIDPMLTGPEGSAVGWRAPGRAVLVTWTEAQCL